MALIERLSDVVPKQNNVTKISIIFNFYQKWTILFV